jgi:hypothetical protein
MICERCLDLIDAADASFCPRCGRNLAAIRTHVPTVEELRTLESQIVEALPRLRELRSCFEAHRREAVARGHQPALDLAERRLAFLTRVERRLEEQLLAARQQLSSHGGASGHSSP